MDTEFAEQYFWGSVITGDTADNIKGIPGKGPAFIKKLWEECKEINLFKSRVICEYINYFGEEAGIDEFYKNYKCLKIKDSYEGIEFIEPIKSTEVYARTLGVVGE